MSWRYATAADIEHYFGDSQRMTLSAVVVLCHGEPVGLMGVAREGVTRRLFSEFKPELASQLRSITVFRAVKAAMRLVSGTRSTVYAVAEHAEGERMLKRLGFVEGPGYFVWRS